MRILMTISLVFSAACLHAQDQSLRDINRKLQSYYENQKLLKTHLFLNQPVYVAGDTIFFRAVVKDAGTLRNADKVTILHVLLMDEQNHAVVNEKVRLREGEASNQLVIPSSLEPGTYLLVAYHDWMKNTSSELFFQTYVEVAGDKLDVRTKEQDFKIVAEGGNILANSDNRLFVEGPGETTAKVINENGTEITSFVTNTDGLSFFNFTPVPATNYFVVASGKRFPIPQASLQGIALTANISDDRSALLVNINANPNAYNRLRLVIDAGDEVFYNSVVKVDNGKATASAPLLDVAGGVARLSVFSDDAKVLAERLFFVNELPVANVSVTVPDQAFLTRKKIEFGVKVNSSGSASKAKISATVFNTNMIGEFSGSNMISDLFFNSEIAGTATNNLENFNPQNSAWLQMADMKLAMTRRQNVAWTDVLTKTTFSPKPTNLKFSGQVINSKTGAVMTDTTFVTFFLQKNIITYQTFTNKGRFDIPLYIDFFGYDEVYYKIEKRGKPVPDAKLVLLEEPALNLNWPQTKETEAPDPFFVNARQKKLINSSFGFYNQHSNYKQVKSPNAPVEEEIFGPDITIDLDKYIVFPTMEETLREIVPMVQHRKVKGVSTIRIYFADQNRPAFENPVYIIDGVMTDDTDYFMSLKPSDVSKIKVVYSRDKLATFGAIGRGGVLIVDTKIPDNNSKIVRSRNSFVVYGFSEPAPVQSILKQPHVRTPDLRTSLYWNPELTTDDNGEATITFYTSDVTGDFRLRLEGLTEDGKPFYTEQNFKVEFKSDVN